MNSPEGTQNVAHKKDRHFGDGTGHKFTAEAGWWVGGYQSYTVLEEKQDFYSREGSVQLILLGFLSCFTRHPSFCILPCE